MKSKAQNNKILSYVFAFSFFLLYLNAITFIWPADTNHALINLVASILPTLFFIFGKEKLGVEKKNMLLVFLLCSLQIITFLLNIEFNSHYDNVADTMNIISYIVNIVGFVIMLKQTDYDSIVLRKSIIVIISCTFLFCIYNLFVNINHLSELLNPRLASIVSFASFYKNRNNFAKLIYLSTVVLYYAKNKKIIGKRVFFLVIVVYIINLIATLSRTGIVSTLLFMLITPIIGKRKHRIKAIAVITMVTIGVLSFGMTDFINTSIVRIDTGDSGRTGIWDSAITMLKEKPIFGYGEHNAAKTLNQETDNSYFHNIVIKNLVVQGVLYVLFYMVFIIYNGKKPLHNKNSNVRNIIIATYFSLTAYCMFEGFDFFNFGLFNSLATMIMFILPNVYNANNEIPMAVIEDEKRNEN